MPDLILWPENEDDDLINGDVEMQLWSYGLDFLTLMIKEERGENSIKLSISERDAYFMYKYLEAVLNAKE